MVWHRSSHSNGGSTATLFASSDIRNSEYNIKRNWYYNDASSDKYGKKAEITEETWTKFTIYPAVTKFFYGKAEDLSYGGNNKDRMKFRLAETYLLLAEARLMQNNAQGAADAINVIRKRANAPEITAKDATITSYWTNVSVNWLVKSYADLRWFVQASWLNA